MAPELAWRKAPGESHIPGVPSRELQGIAALWKRTQRELTVSFGGTSMLPTIAPGASLRMVCTDEVVPADVLVFVHLDQVVVHRLVARSRSWWLTRGDARVVPDLPFTDRGTIVGKIVGIESADGFVPLGPAPITLARAVALLLARLGGILGAGGVRAMVRLMEAAATARRALRGKTQW